MKKVWFEDKEQTGELSFPRLFRQEEGTQNVLFEDKETTLES
jgi:hypothetical protein